METYLARELVYSMKINFWMHDDPQRVKIVKLDPIARGTREQVFNKMKRPL